MLRRIGLALILFGLVGVWLYPTWFRTYYNVELGAYRIHDAQGGFRSITNVSLSPDAMPLRLDISGRGIVPAGGGEAPNATLVVRGPQGDVLARVIDLEPHSAEDGTSASGVELRTTVNIEEGIADGSHDFVFGEGDRDGIPISFLDMELTGAVAAADPRVRPVSMAMFAMGLLLMLLPFFGRRRRRALAPENRPPGRPGTSNIGRRVPLDRKDAAPEEPARRWGRDADRD